MNSKHLFDAIAYVGPDLIDLAERKQFRRNPWPSILATAAALALVFGLGTFYVQRQNPPPVLEQPAEQEPLIPEQEPPVPEPLPEPGQDIQTRLPMVDWNTTPMENFDLAGLDQAGSDFQTRQGDQLLALDVENEIVLIRVRDEGYQGVLAICADRSRLELCPSSQQGIIGETVGTIARAHDGILAMNGSAFWDDQGVGNGNTPAGVTLYEGVRADDAGAIYSQVRLDIDWDGWFHFSGPEEAIADATRYALSFHPALIKNGTILVDENCGYTGIQPRAVIGQDREGRILMLVIEGRMPDRSLGTDVVECAEILARYDCETALNLDGGTSALLWYNGRPVTQCSNQTTPEGRLLPDALVIRKAE